MKDSDIIHRLISNLSDTPESKEHILTLVQCENKRCEIIRSIRKNGQTRTVHAIRNAMNMTAPVKNSGSVHASQPRVTKNRTHKPSQYTFKPSKYSIAPSLFPRPAPSSPPPVSSPISSPISSLTSSQSVRPPPIMQRRFHNSIASIPEIKVLHDKMATKDCHTQSKERPRLTNLSF